MLIYLFNCCVNRCLCRHNFIDESRDENHQRCSRANLQLRLLGMSHSAGANIINAIG